jgi:hypothetical protein
MAIYRLLKNGVFGPDDVKVLTTAYEEALRALRLKDRSDPATEMIAKKIIELAQRGERDPVRLREYAIRGLSESVCLSGSACGRRAVVEPRVFFATRAIGRYRVADRLRQRFGETAIGPVVHMQTVRR